MNCVEERHKLHIFHQNLLFHRFLLVVQEIELHVGHHKHRSEDLSVPPVWVDGLGMHFGVSARPLQQLLENHSGILYEGPFPLAWC